MIIHNYLGGSKVKFGKNLIKYRLPLKKPILEVETTMKKTLSMLTLCTLLISMSIAGVVSQVETIQISRTLKETTPVEWTGEFSGSYGIGLGENHTVLGSIEGGYKSNAGNRICGFFLANWTSLDEIKSGNIRGIFTPHAILGKISSDTYNRTARAIGFLRYNDTKFIGRIMSWIGPAVYIYGDHWTI